MRAPPAERLQELFAAAGNTASIEVGSDAPFFLEGDDAWLVMAGRIDVFAVTLRDGAPAGGRAHLFRVAEGGLLLGMRNAGAERAIALLAVGATGTRVVRLARSSIDELARDPRHAPRVGALLDEWIDVLCMSVAEGLPPQSCWELQLGEHEPPDGVQRVRPVARISWIRHDAGTSRFLGREGLKVNGGGYTPLSRRAWLEITRGSRLTAVDTSELLGRAELWDGIARLHELVIDHTSARAAAAAHAERERLKRKATVRQLVLRNAYTSLTESINVGNARRRWTAARRRALHANEDAEDPLFMACRLVGDELGIAVSPPPGRAQGAHGMEPIAAIARASRIRCREIVLRDGWWRQDVGPFVARHAVSQEPVAVLRGAHSGYVLYDPVTGSEQPVTRASADTLDPRAYTFFRPFREERLQLGDVVRFGLRGCERDLAVVLFMSAAAGLLSLLPAIATGLIFNDIVPSAARHQLLQLTAILLAVALATALFEVTRAVALVRIEAKMGTALQSAVWDRLLTLPLPFFRPFSAGDVAMRAMGIDYMRQLFAGAIVTALLGGVFSLVHFGLLYYYSVKLAVWATLLFAVALAMAFFASRLQLKHERGLTAIQTRIAGAVLQFLTSISKLRVAGAEVHAYALWARDFSRQRTLQFRAHSVGNILASFNAGFALLAALVIYAAAMPLLRTGTDLRTGDFLAFMTSFTTCLSGLLMATSAALTTLTVVPLYELAQPILATAPEVDTGKADPGVLSGSIEVQHLHFRYDEHAPLVLRDVTLRIEPGEFVAFVGPSGSGKSTLLRLLLGFEQPESGAIYYDGQEFSGLDRYAVRRQIGVVLQNGKLMPGDLFTNIVGSSTATLDEAWDAARRAGLEEDIRAMPMGMHTVVSEGMGTLSGGQRQRLMIARALVRKPRLLFFDEATSALDNRTQATVSESLEHTQATRIVIAHRLSTIINADTIYVIAGGRIVDYGTYEQLLGRDGVFQDLAKRQLL